MGQTGTWYKFKWESLYPYKVIRWREKKPINKASKRALHGAPTGPAWPVEIAGEMISTGLRRASGTARSTHSG